MGEDTRWHDRDPKTPAELYDMLRWAFGLGTYSDDEPTPFFQTRNKEIAKLKAAMTKRRISIEEVVLAARYCKAQHIPVLYLNQLWKELGNAKAAQRALPSDIQTHVEDAIAHENWLGAPDSAYWIERLNRAVGPYREEVLDEWKQSRTTPARAKA